MTTHDVYGGIPNSNAGLTFVDFLPNCCDPGGLLKVAVYERFGTLIDRANGWLQTHRNWDLVTCESVEFKAWGEAVLANQMTYMERGETSTWYVRGLRLWLIERKNEAERDQALQIGYLNLIPQQVGNPDMFDHLSYQTLYDVIRRFNSSQSSHPLPGRVITIETQEMKMSRGNYHDLDPDRSYWKERGEVMKRFLFILRIFYEVAPENYEEIGIKDFIPDKVKDGGLLTFPDYEPFTNVVKKAAAWCSRQEGLRFCNVQSVEIKLKTGNSSINCLRTEFTEHGGRRTCYLRILRVAYARPSSASHSMPDELEPSSPEVSQLYCRTFVPVQLTTSLFLPEYETSQQTRERVDAWVRETGAHVLSAETSAIRIYTGGERKHGPEATFTYNQSKRSEYWIFVIRLYLDRYYREPSPELLPPVPEIKSSNCCFIL